MQYVSAGLEASLLVYLSCHFVYFAITIMHIVGIKSKYQKTYIFCIFSHCMYFFLHHATIMIIAES